MTHKFFNEEWNTYEKENNHNSSSIDYYPNGNNSTKHEKGSTISELQFFE